MIKRRDKKTGAISFIPTAEDIEKQRYEIRLSQLEKKVNQLENLIIELKKDEQKITENIISDVIIDEDIKIEEKPEVLIKEKKRKNTKKKKVDEDN